MVDGVAGENIIIEYEEEVLPEDLGKRIAIENQDTGRRALLDLVRFASPCREFSLFAAGSQHEQRPPLMQDGHEVGEEIQMPSGGA